VSKRRTHHNGSQMLVQSSSSVPTATQPPVAVVEDRDGNLRAGSAPRRDGPTSARNCPLLPCSRYRHPARPRVERQHGRVFPLEPSVCGSASDRRFQTNRVAPLRSCISRRPERVPFACPAARQRTHSLSAGHTCCRPADTDAVRERLGRPAGRSRRTLSRSGCLDTNRAKTSSS